MSRPEAIRRVTSMPADFLRLEKRGRIMEGYFADIALLDWDHLRDRATYTDPTQLSEGVQAVFVNGKLAYWAGSITNADAGKLLKR